MNTEYRILNSEICRDLSSRISSLRGVLRSLGEGERRGNLSVQPVMWRRQSCPSVGRQADRPSHSILCIQHSVFRTRRCSAAAFTLIEMMVVLAIIGLVLAMSIPMLTPFMRGRKVEQAAQAVKSSCILARSRAVKQRQRYSVTLLESERTVYVNDYEQLRYMLPAVEFMEADSGSEAENQSGIHPARFKRKTSTENWTGYYVTLISGGAVGVTRKITGIDSGDSTILELDQDWPGSPAILPSLDDLYIIGGRDPSKAAPYTYLCPHELDNYDVTGAYTEEEKRDLRSRILSETAVTQPKVLPEGCRFDLDGNDADSANVEPDGWSYIFKPTGGVMTLNTDAINENDVNWSEMTCKDAGGELSGPFVYGPGDRYYRKIIVYAMTGQAVDEE